MLGSVYDLFAVIGPERAAVVTEFVSKLPRVFAIGVHGVDVEVAIARGSEDDVLAVARYGGLGVVAWRVDEELQVAAVWLGGVDAIGIVDGPDVAARIIGLGRAFDAGSVRGRKKNAIAGRK